MPQDLGNQDLRKRKSMNMLSALAQVGVTSAAGRTWISSGSSIGVRRSRKKSGASTYFCAARPHEARIDRRSTEHGIDKMGSQTGGHQAPFAPQSIQAPDSGAASVVADQRVAIVTRRSHRDAVLENLCSLRSEFFPRHHGPPSAQLLAITLRDRIANIRAKCVTVVGRTDQVFVPGKRYDPPLMVKDMVRDKAAAADLQDISSSWMKR